MKGSITLEELLISLKDNIKKIILFSALAFISIFIIVNFFMKEEHKVSKYIYIGVESNINTPYSFDRGVWYRQLRKKAYTKLVDEKFIRDSLNENFNEEDIQYAIDKLRVIPQSDYRVLELRLEDNEKIESEKVVGSLLENFIEISPKVVENVSVREESNYSSNKNLDLSIRQVFYIIGGLIIFIIDLVILLYKK